MIIGICGGIGSGKSVVSRILRLRGEHVYDCDLEAKRLMDTSEEVLAALHVRYGDEVCPPGGPICRARLAGKIFASEEERLWLNALVHRMVREDVDRCHRVLKVEGCGRMYVESAILASSGLASMCGEVWLVAASDDVRMERVRLRDALPADAVMRRMAAQREEERLLEAAGIPVRIIDNSGDTPILTIINS